MHRLTPILFLALAAAAPVPASADRAAAFEAERRWFAGIAGATAQSRFNVAESAGGSTNSLDDGVILRLGRFGRPARYGVDLMYARHDEAIAWFGTAWLDYIIPWGDIFSGYAGIAVGGVHLNWRSNDPFGAGSNQGAKDASAGSWAAGLRVGGLIEVTELVQVELGYRYLLTGLETEFDNGATVQMRNQRAVHAGVNFRF